MGASDKPTTIVDLKGQGSVNDYYASKDGNAELPEWAKGTSAALEALGVSVGETAERAATEKTSEALKSLPRPVPPKTGADKLTNRVTERLNNRLLNIFGSKEKQEWYVNKIREAIEKMNEEKLHEFIMAHQRYGKGETSGWNQDFRELIGINPEDAYKGKNEEDTNRMIMAGAQCYLVSYFNKAAFREAGKEKSINPWTFIDGKCGPYSVSVLGEYWTLRFGSTSKKTPNPPHNAGLSPDYPWNDAEKRSFDEALKYKDSLFHTTPGEAPAGGQTTAPAAAPSTNSAPNADQKVKDRYVKLDRASESLPLKDLQIDYEFEADMPNLSTALATAYAETLTKNPATAPKTFRVLHLLANIMGRRIDEFTNTIKANDTLKINEDGLMTITDQTGNERLKAQLWTTIKAASDVPAAPGKAPAGGSTTTPGATPSSASGFDADQKVEKKTTEHPSGDIRVGTTEKVEVASVVATSPTVTPSAEAPLTGMSKLLADERRMTELEQAVKIAEGKKISTALELEIAENEVRKITERVNALTQEYDKAKKYYDSLEDSNPSKSAAKLRMSELEKKINDVKAGLSAPNEKLRGVKAAHDKVIDEEKAAREALKLEQNLDEAERASGIRRSRLQLLTDFIGL